MSRLRRFRVRISPTVVAVMAGLALALALLSVVVLVGAVVHRSDDIAAIAHRSLQQSIDARYDDCIAGDAVRRALYQQAQAASRSDALLYRLLPSLDTPEVRKLVRRTRARQLRAFRPRGTDGCLIYAMRVVPKNAPGNYTVHYRTHVSKPVR